MDTNDLSEKYKILSNLIFPDIKETIDDLEKKYPQRNLEEGACVTRYAPSPTGFLHIGALYASLVNKKIATQTNGIFYVRIEDTDRKREVEGSKLLLTKQLHEFGIDPDEGVISESEEIGNYGPYTQSLRENIYKICAKYLIEKGLAYPCFCTQEMNDARHESQEKNKVIPGYYGIYARCRNISVDEYIERVKNNDEYILRFRSQGSHLRKISYIDGIRGKIEIAENDQDLVIIKSDGLPTYHFAHIVDDHFMRTTHVIRGEEWIASVPMHLELSNAMNFKAPVYGHLPTIMKKDGESKRKLSKRKDKEADVSYFLNAGYPVNSIREYLLSIINSDFEPWRMKNPYAVESEFKIRLEKMGASGALFDQVKLNDISKEIIAKMSGKEVLESVLEWSNKYDKELNSLLNSDLEYAHKIFSLERDNVTKIRKDIFKWEDIIPNFFYFFNELYEKDIKDNGYMFDFNVNPQEAKISNENTIKVLESYINAYDFNLDKDGWFNQMKEVANSLGFAIDNKEYKANPDKYIGNISDVATIIRIALTNRKNTPDIYAIMQILGKDEVINRLKKAMNI